MAYLEPNEEYLDALLQAEGANQAERERRANQNTGAFGDAITSLERGIYSLPSAITGLADIVPSAVLGIRPMSATADFIGDVTGLDWDRFAEEQQQEYSDEYLRQQAEVEKAKGLDVVPALLKNPRVLAGDVLSSLPHMIAGGGLGAAARMALPKLGALAGAGVGEGAIMAGASMADMEQAGVDPRLASLLSLGVGGIGAGIGIAGGKLADRLGIADPETYLQRFFAEETKIGRQQLLPLTTTQKAGAAAGRAGLGGALEGAEEFAQSSVETAAMNIGTGEDIGEGVLTQGLRGAVSGAVLGGGANVLRDVANPPRMAITDQRVPDAETPQAPPEGETPEQIELFRRRAQRMADEARQAETVEGQRAAGVQEMLGLAGVGQGTIDLLNRMEGVESKEDFDERLDALPSNKMPQKRKDALRGTTYYENLPKRDEVNQAALVRQAEIEAELEAEAAAYAEAEPTVTAEQEQEADALTYTEEESLQDELQGVQDELDELRAEGIEDPEVEQALQQELSRKTGLAGEKESSSSYSYRDRRKVDYGNADVATVLAATGEKPAVTERAAAAISELLSGFTDAAVEKTRLRRLSANRTQSNAFKKMLVDLFPGKLTNKNAQVEKKYGATDAGKLLREIRQLSFPTKSLFAGLETKAEIAQATTNERRKLNQLSRKVAGNPAFNLQQRLALLRIIATHKRAYGFSADPVTKKLRDRNLTQLGLKDPALRAKGEEVMNLVEVLQDNMRRYDALVAVLGGDRPAVIKNAGKLGRVTGPAPTKEGKSTIPLTDLQLPESVTGAEKPIELNDEAILGQYALIEGDIDGTGREAPIYGINDVAGFIAQNISRLEELLGRENILAAMRYSKDSRNPQVKNKKGNETQSATRFSRLYRLYREHDGKIPPWAASSEYRNANVGYDAEGRALDAKTGKPIDDDRIVTFTGNGLRSVQRYDGTPVDPNRTVQAPGALDQPLRMEQIILQAQDDKRNKGEKNPVLVMLKHINHTSTSPMARLLARQLHAILAAGDRTWVDSITVELYGQLPPEHKVGQRKRGAFGMDDNGKPVLRLFGQWVPETKDGKPYKNPQSAAGMSEDTFLHEVVHAATVGVLERANLTEPQKKAVAELKAVRTAADRLLREDIATAKSEGDTEKVAALEDLYDQMRAVAGRGTIDLQEFIAAVMTNPQAQDWMSQIPSTRLRDSELTNIDKKARKNHNIWRMFRDAIKSLLQTRAVADSFFEHVVNASASVLGQVYEDANTSQSVFARKKGLTKKKSSIGSRLTGEVSSSSSSPIDVDAFRDSPEADQLAEVLEAESRTQTATGRARRTANEKSRRAAAKARGAAVVESQAEGLTTAVDPSTKKDSKVFFLSRLEQAVFDNAVRLFAPMFGKNFTTYKEAMQALLDWSARKGRRFVEDPENKQSPPVAGLAAAVGAVLSATVDQYGVDPTIQGVAHDAEAATNGFVSGSTAFFDRFVNTPYHIQDALVMHVLDPTINLATVLTDKVARDSVQSMYEGLKGLQRQAAERGAISEEDGQLELADFLHKYLDMYNRGDITVDPRFNTSRLKPAKKQNFVIIEDLAASQIFDEDGGNDPEYYENTKFYRVASKDPTLQGSGTATAFISVNASKDTLDKLNLGFGKDKSVYTLTMVEGDMQMRRRKTPQEIREELNLAGHKRGKGAAQATAALANLMQDLGRRVEGANAIMHMEYLNDGLKPDERWFVDPNPSPDDADGVEALRLIQELPEHKVIDISQQTEARGFTGWRRRARLPGVWVLIPPGPEYQREFGNLAGQYVAGPVYSSLADYQDTKPLIPSHTYRQILRMWKKNKTVYSTAAHINNITSNVVLSYIYDLPVENIRTAAKIIILHGMYGNSSLAKKYPLTPEERALAEEKDRVGITLGQMKTADLDARAERELSDFLRNTSDDSSQRGLIRTFLSFSQVQTAINLMDKANDLYSNQDNVFRLAAYMKHLQDYGQHRDADGVLREGIGPNGEITIESRRAAAQAANKAFVDYRVHAPAIRAAKDTVLPFITWTYRMAPLLAKTALLKPWKMANLAAGIYAVNALGYALSGGDEDEERRLLPDYLQDNVGWLKWAPVDVPTTIRLPFGLDADTPHFMNIGRMVPLADITQTNNTGIPMAFAFGGPLAILWSMGANYDPFTGKEITDWNRTDGQNAMDYLKFFGAAAGPGTAVAAGKAADKLGVLNDADLKPLGTKYSSWTQMAKVAGLNVYHMDVPEAAYAKEQEVEYIRRRFKQTMAKEWRRELRTTTPDTRSMEETRMELELELQRAILEAYNLNPEDYE